MKIHFLGTSAGWPLPRLGHHCTLCDSTDPRDTRLRASVLINETILIDAGPDTYQKLRTIDPTKLKYVILTHWHQDHVLGTWDLTHIYNDKEKTKPLLIGTPPTIAYLKKYNERIVDLPLKEIQFGEKISLDGIEFLGFEVTHTEGTIGIHLTQEGKTAVYIPDFKTIPTANLKYIHGVDMLIMDGSSLTKNTETPGHQSIETGLQLAHQAQPKQVAFTHLGHKSGLHATLETYVHTHGKDAYFIPYDGLEVTI